MGGYPKWSYHHGDLKNALLEASLKLIGEVGPEAFTLREVARALGVNHTAVYRHFEDKRALLAAIAEQGFDPVYGARPLRRFIAHEVETRIGRALLSGDVHDGATIRVELVDGELAVTYENPALEEQAA